MSATQYQQPRVLLAVLSRQTQPEQGGEPTVGGGVSLKMSSGRFCELLEIGMMVR